MEPLSCAICWRQYDLTTVVPSVLPCGHSFCMDCASMVRACSLCRQRLPNNYQRKANFTLVSAIEQLSKQTRPQTTEQQTQTDDLSQPQTIRRRQTQAISFFQGKTMTVNVRKTGLQFSIT